MARQPVHLVAASKRPVSRDAMWAAIRHFGKFTVPQLAGETNIHRDTIKTYVDGLEAAGYLERVGREGGQGGKIGRVSCRERVCQYVSISVVAESLNKKTHTTQTKYK